MQEKPIALQQSEWHIMQQLWQQPQGITQLCKSLSPVTAWSKSTVNTMLSRMLEKQLIGYTEGEKARQYYAKIKREDIAVSETASLVDRVFNGSVSMMMSTLVKSKPLSKSEIEQLYYILESEAQKHV